MDRANWWERRWFLALLVLGAAIPLLWPETPPLVDLPGHMGRYRVQLDLADSPVLQRYFEFRWAIIGNLGVDLLVIPLARLVGLEPAVKLIVLSTPPLTVAGLLWVAKEVHHRIPPTAMFAIPLVYGYPFNFGFVNFALSVAFAFLALGLWLHLTNASRIRLRTSLFVPISCALWITHAFGWGLLGLLAFSTEVIRNRDRGNDWRQAVIGAALSVLPLTLPLVLMIIWRSGAAGSKTDLFFHLTGKLLAILAAVRDRWFAWDSFAVGAILVLLGAALFDRQLEMSRRLSLPAAILVLAFALMPGRVFGSYYADMRLVPIMLMVALLAVRVRADHLHVSRALAWLGLAFVILRLGGNTISFAIQDRQTRTWLTALDSVPQGAPVLILTGVRCVRKWEMERHDHLGSFVIVRRRGFANGQWEVPGAQLLRIRYPEAGEFATHGSNFVIPESCIQRTQPRPGKPPAYDRSAESALARFPRDAFDYVWIIDAPDGFDMKARPGLEPIWRRDRSVLYRVEHGGRR